MSTDKEKRLAALEAEEGPIDWRKRYEERQALAASARAAIEVRLLNPELIGTPEPDDGRPSVMSKAESLAIIEARLDRLAGDDDDGDEPRDEP